MNKLSENLKKIRKDNNLSQEQLADKLGVSRQAISKWESGTAYPEMEKLIQICQDFDLNIDDLLNKDIRETKGEQETKNNINKYIEDFLHFITDTVNLFINMSFKTKIKCLFEQVLIAICLLIMFSVLGWMCSSIVGHIFYPLIPNKIYYGIYGILSGIYQIFAFITSITILVHIFKTRYLDYYKSVKKVEKNKEAEIEDQNQNSKYEIQDANIKASLKKDEDKIIIRDPKHSEYKFINEIFKFIILIIKFFSIIFALFLCSMVIFLATGFILSFTVIKTGIFFIGLIFSSASLISVLIIFILLIFNFVFNRKNNKKKMIWAFITSIIIFGISFGLILIGILNFKIIDDMNDDMIKTSSFEFDMIDDMVILNNEEIEFVEKDIDNIVVEYNINKKCDVKHEILNTYGKKTLHLSNFCPSKIEMVKFALEEVNKNKIINLNSDILNIKVYGSKNNIEKLKNNETEYYTDKENQEKIYNNYEEKIRKLEEEIEIKNEEIIELNQKIEELK